MIIFKDFPTRILQVIKGMLAVERKGAKTGL